MHLHGGGLQQARSVRKGVLERRRRAWPSGYYGISSVGGPHPSKSSSMGNISSPQPVLLLIAVSSRYDEALAWSEKQSAATYGAVRLASEAFDFTETDYYADSMGTDLKKQFLVFDNLIDPGELPKIKRITNEWELEYADSGDHPEVRPLNLDPGYLTLAKLVLASTKDHAHRLYLHDGIYAEVTLHYRNRGWQSSEWTYPDYQREDFQQFFTQCRQTLRGRATVDPRN